MIGFQQTEDLANRRQAAAARGGGGVRDSIEIRQETCRILTILVITSALSTYLQERTKNH